MGRTRAGAGKTPARVFNIKPHQSYFTVKPAMR